MLHELQYAVTLPVYVYTKWKEINNIIEKQKNEVYVFLFYNNTVNKKQTFSFIS